MLWTRKILVRFFLRVLYIQFASGQEYEIRTNSEECVLASPKIMYSSDGNHIELPQNISDAIQESERVDIGYWEAFGVFQYIGCRELSDLPKKGIKHSINSDPGQCYSACKSKYFAIYTTDCYCLKTNVPGTGTVCNEECSFPDHTACGGQNTTINVSLYKYLESGETGNDDGRLCGAYNTETASYEWADCGNSLPGLINDGNLTFYTKYYTWSNYVNAKKWYSLANGTLLWKKRIRSLVIKDTHESKGTDKDLYRQGYIEKENGKFRLEFGKNQSTETTKYLCLRDHSPGASNLSTTVSIEYSTFSSTSTKGTTLSIQNPQHDQKNWKRLIYVTVPVCVFVIIVCVVVLELIQIRRRRSRAISETQYHGRYSSRQDLVLERDLGPNIDSIDAPEVYLPEPYGYDSIVFNTLRPCASNAAHYGPDGEYDTIKTLTDTKMIRTEYSNANIYNKYGDEVNGVYDHSDVVKVHTGCADDDTYDHVKNDSDTDDYHTLNYCSEMHEAPQHSDNVYDHANSHKK